MSTVPLERLSLSALPAPRREEQSRPNLVPVDTPAPRRGPGPVVAALTAVGIVLAILATQLGLSIATSQGAYESRALELEQRELLRVERVLTQNLDKLASPQNLAENAVQLGMVQNTHPASLRLSDNAVLGNLSSQTTAATGNLVANAALDDLPILDETGAAVERNAGQAEAAAAPVANVPVAWQGKLPAPNTH